jgi:hypothetical protein
LNQKVRGQVQVFCVHLPQLQRHRQKGKWNSPEKVDMKNIQIQINFENGGNTKKGQAAKVNLVRFADDFIITGSSQQLLNDEVKPLVKASLKERGLELSEEKTRIAHIETGFDFLGQNIRKYDGKLLIKPEAKNVQASLKKVRSIIKTNKTATAGHLILQLNPVIQGWANYHRHIVSKQTFSWVDMHIFRPVWWWAKRRHPSRAKEWIRQKYFGTSHRRRWALIMWFTLKFRPCGAVACSGCSKITSGMKR